MCKIAKIEVLASFITIFPETVTNPAYLDVPELI